MDSAGEMGLAILEIVGVDVLLGGDNAVVIALACRGLPPLHQKRAILVGTGGAIVIRSALTVFAVALLALPYLKMIGAALLLWIGSKLLVPDDEEGSEGGGDTTTTMFAAIRTIVVADLVMSLDNVLAVAAAAKDHAGLVVFGLLLSIPIIVWGSTMVIKLMDRFPVTVTLGAALLGYISGEMAIKDVAVAGWVDAHAHWLHYVAPAAGALLVVAVGKSVARRRKPALVELHTEEHPEG
jgi:YjbE family integral membrane protein